VEKLFKNSLTMQAQESWQVLKPQHLKVTVIMVSCLLIDDDAHERAQIAGQLAQLDVAVSQRADVEAGIRFCHENRPDIVLLEASVLPRAKEFLRLVRQQNRATGKPVIILYATAATMTTVGESILSGASEFMLAPFDLDTLKFKLMQYGVLMPVAA
jgi:DNA-binding response OmpR family regulator